MTGIVVVLGVILLALVVLALRVGVAMGIGWIGFFVASCFGADSVMPFDGVPYSLAFMIGAVVAVLVFAAGFFGSD